MVELGLEIFRGVHKLLNHLEVSPWEYYPLVPFHHLDQPDFAFQQCKVLSKAGPGSPSEPD